MSETRRAWKALKRVERELLTARQLLETQIRVGGPVAKALERVRSAQFATLGAREILEQAGLNSLPGD